MTEPYITKFILRNVETGAVIRTARFGEFDTKPERGRLLAQRYIENEKAAWESMSHQFVGGERLAQLEIVEG